MREEERVRDRKTLEDFLVRNDIALIKVGFFKERYHKSKEDDSKRMLPRRNDIPLHQRLHGTRLRGLWTDASPPGGSRQLFAVSHAWLALGGTGGGSVVDEGDGRGSDILRLLQPVSERPLPPRLRGRSATPSRPRSFAHGDRGSAVSNCQALHGCDLCE
mmetsp:Transcript_90837/g.291186  ORF Transcript_90837/g.291186 Transcript_90837/m.291186 type:complete len:160 (+) Transcript_90837:160-639(+)